MENREIITYALIKLEYKVEFKIFYFIGSEEYERGYYYSATPFNIDTNGNVLYYYSEDYSISNTLIKKAKKFNKQILNESKNLAYSIYLNYLMDNNFLSNIRDFDKCNTIDEVIVTIQALGNRKEEDDLEDEIIHEKNKINSNLSLDNVILNDDIKTSISQVIHFIKNKEAYDKIGAKMPKGILLYGPPGTGKTTIAKLIAQQTNSSFFNIAGPEFVEKYVGVGAKRVRTLFEKARKEAPSIIFIDEIDAVGSQRTSDENKEKDQTLNQLLVELDGFEELDNVIVIAATNRLDLLDKALIRPGRFDRKLFIDLPNEENRYKLFELFLNKITTDSNIDYNLLSIISQNYSGADISNICNEAAIQAVSESREYVTQDDLENVINKNQKNYNKIQKTIGFM